MDWELIVIATRIPLQQYIKINIVFKVLSNYLNKIVWLCDLSIVLVFQYFWSVTPNNVE